MKNMIENANTPLSVWLIVHFFVLHWIKKTWIEFWLFEMRRIIMKKQTKIFIHRWKNWLWTKKSWFLLIRNSRHKQLFFKYWFFYDFKTTIVFSKLKTSTMSSSLFVAIILIFFFRYNIFFENWKKKQLIFLVSRQRIFSRIYSFIFREKTHDENFEKKFENFVDGLLVQNK